MRSSRPIPCSECLLAAAWVDGAHLVIKQRHHQRWHETRLSLEQVVRLLRESERVMEGVGA